MYRREPLFPYAVGRCGAMPPGLPDRFYPEDPSRVYKTEDYVICFAEGTPEDIKERFIKDYAEYHAKQEEMWLSGGPIIF